MLRQELEHGIRIVRVGDPLLAGGDSSNRLGQGSVSRPGSDRYLFPCEKDFDNAEVDLEMIGASKLSMSL